VFFEPGRICSASLRSIRPRLRLFANLVEQRALIELGIDGKSASGALQPGFEVAITTTAGSQLVPPDVVL